MSSNKKKTSLHPRNKNRDRYDLKALTNTIPALANYVQPNQLGNPTINFADPKAVKLLNQALLHHYYGIAHWDFPEENLCPPIPGRAEYIHHIADLLGESNANSIPKGAKITCLDIGVGASCIYPIIGVVEYGWRFVGSDIDPKSIYNAEQIVRFNPSLKGKIKLRIQRNPQFIFKDIITTKDQFDVTICNPPFHASKAELLQGNQRKVKNLRGKNTATPQFNFSGNSNELIYQGGEFRFIKNMIKESKTFAKSVFWFSTLVSKVSNLKKIEQELAKYHPVEQRTMEIKTGNKTARIVAWTYLTSAEQTIWQQQRWD